jgi:2-(1,2-epoxy-1,2-dihydrophenyl)acetyl-CoA isomerase
LNRHGHGRARAEEEATSTMPHDRIDEPTGHIRMERDGAVGTITLDRPERFNALDRRMARDLLRASTTYAQDEAVRCIVLAGGERAFCSGADLKAIRHETTLATREGQAPDYGPGFRAIVGDIHRTILALKRAPKPVVAAVDGVAAAGGFGLAMACDLVLASEGASFEWAYHKAGLTGAESSTFFLPRLVGLRRAMGLMLLNPRLDAGAALAAGLITEVLPRDGFEASVRRIAERLASGPTAAYGIAKGLFHESAGVDELERHLDRELDALVRAAGGRDVDEGLTAFFAKREPVFHPAPSRPRAA